jgi:hypothetical protein
LSLADQLRGRFGGFWNKVFLILVAIVCLRFAGAEWAGAPLSKRLLVALLLMLGCFGLGIVFGVFRIAVEHSDPFRHWDECIAWGLKSGIATASVLLFLVGVLMVKDYLGPLSDVLAKLAEPLLKKIGLAAL